MTIKEFLLKSIYDGMGMEQFRRDCASTENAMRDAGIKIADDAKVMSQKVIDSVNKAGIGIREVASVYKSNGQLINASFKQMSNGATSISTNMVTAGNSTSGFNQRIGQLISRALLTLPVWEAMRAGLRGIEEVFQSSIHFAIEWETEMSRIQIVTNISKEQLSGLSDALLNVAEKFGMSSKDVAETANQWLRMGATIDTVIPLLEQTSKLSLMTGKSMEESAKSINVWRSAYHMGSDEVSKSLDKLIGIQSASGVSLEVLLEGFDKLGVKGSQVGLNFNQLAGYIAAVNQVSRQTGETIGTQLNMMLNRMGSNAVQAAQNISGVSFYLDANGKATKEATSTFRDTDDILMDLSRSWSHLGNVQQDALAKTLGSQRQVTSIIALLQNYTSAVKASDAALGDSQSDIATRLDTTQEKVKQLQAAWDKFINSTSIQTGMKNSLDFLIRMVDTLNVKLADAQRIHERFFLRTALAGNPNIAKDLGIKEKNPWVGYSDEDLDKILNQRATQKKNMQSSTVNKNTEQKNTTNNTITSSLLSEQTIREKIANLETSAASSGEQKATLLQKEINLWQQADGISQKVATTQIQSLQVKLANVEAQDRINALAHQEADIEEQMRAEGASKLEIDIQHLAFLKESGALQKSIDAQQKTVDIETQQLQKSVADQIIDALNSQQKVQGETALAQIQQKIALEDQLGIHLQGIDLLKQQLELYKAITDESKKSTQEKQKELAELIKKTPGPEKTGYAVTTKNERNEERLTQEALKKGISQNVIDSILHPNTNAKTGGVNSLQDELTKSLSDPLGSNIHNLANTISRLADAIEHPHVGNSLTNNQSFVSPTQTPLTSTQSATSGYGQSGWAKYTEAHNTSRQVNLDIGGIQVGFTASNKKELSDEVKKELAELIQAHLLKPGTKLNKATQNVIENF